MLFPAFLRSLIKRVHAFVQRLRSSKEWRIFYSQRFFLEINTRKVLNHLIAWTLPASSKKDQGITLGPQAAVSFEQDGVVILSNLISEESIEAITNFLSTKPLYGGSIHKYYDIVDILLAPGMLDILSNPAFISIAESVFGCKPTLSEVTCWWLYHSYDRSEATKDHSFYADRQLEYHRDMDNWIVLRVLIYLTDVTSESGPHTYLKGTNNMNFMAFRAFDLGKKRFAKLLARKIDIVGKRGTAIVMNPYGLHRAVVPKSEDRLVLGFSYSFHKTPFTPKEPVCNIGMSKNHDQYLMRHYIKS